MLRRRPGIAWLLLCASLLAAMLPRRVTADADFESVRTGMLEDHSGKAGDPKEKFFHESTFHPHYDGRFTDRQLHESERRPTLVTMIRAYLSAMTDLGAETWVMHGTLLGWWWNGQILPWDSDIDVQMTLDTLAFLHNFYQLYVFHYEPPPEQEGPDGGKGDGGGAGVTEEATSKGRGRDYMLEINPDFARKTKWDHLNTIDARWIDMQSGVFIDITALRPNDTARARGQWEALECKDNHKYNESDIFPLRDSYFEGLPTKIPYEYAWLLEEEYTKESLTRTEFENHRFNQTTMEWVPVKMNHPPYPSGRGRGRMMRDRGGQQP